MFGVFDTYELQVIFDWLRGPLSADGQAYTEVKPPIDFTPASALRKPTFRAMSKVSAELPYINIENDDESHKCRSFGCVGLTDRQKNVAAR